VLTKKRDIWLAKILHALRRNEIQEIQDAGRVRRGPHHESLRSSEADNIPAKRKDRSEADNIKNTPKNSMDQLMQDREQGKQVSDPSNNKVFQR